MAAERAVKEVGCARGHQRSQPPQRSVPLRPGAPLTITGMLALQRTAGNSAVTTMVQRKLDTGGADLQSDRFSPSAKLEACFDDRARLRRNDPDTDAVRRIQAALLELETTTGRSYDLGPAGVDGFYGPKTEAAIKKFKADENLGFTQYGDVGPGTMRRLDQIFAGGGGKIDPVPPEVDPLITDGPPGVQVGPTPVETGSPEPLPAYDPPPRSGPGRRGGGLPIGPPDFASSFSSFSSFAPKSSGGKDALKSGGTLREAIEEVVKRDEASIFKRKVDGIFAELRGQVSTFFDRLKAVVRQTVRVSINALVNAIAFAIGGPVGLGVVSIFRRAWKAIAGWFSGKNDDPIDSLADKVSRLVTVYIDRLKKLLDDAIAAQKQRFEGLDPTKPIRGTLADVRNFIRGIARSKVVENVRKIFGGYESVIRSLRENLKKLGFKLGDFPVIGQVDNVVTELNQALDPGIRD